MGEVPAKWPITDTASPPIFWVDRSSEDGRSVAYRPTPAREEMLSSWSFGSKPVTRTRVGFL